MSARIKNGGMTLRLALTLSVGLSGLACAKQDVLLKHPDAPMVLLSNVRARVAVENPEEPGELIEFGVTTLRRGQTVTWYDWGHELPSESKTVQPWWVRLFTGKD